MAWFRLHWHSRMQSEVPVTEVEGDTLADACIKSGIPETDLIMLVGFHQDGKYTEIAASAPCNCFGHAEDGTSCQHDLAKFGLDQEAYERLESFADLDEQARSGFPD